MFLRLIQTIRLGIFSLLLHKLRSGLAVLGILIGIAAVIWLVAFGEGVSYQAQQQIKDLGANNIIVRSIKPASQASASSSFFLEYGLLRADYDRIKSNVPVIQQAVPMRVLPREVRYGSRTVEAQLVGCTPEYMTFNRLTVQRGRFINTVDSNPPENVCVLGAKIAQVLFPLSNPIGESVQIDRDFYVVIGQTAERDPTAAIGGSLESKDYNSDIYIPLETLRTRIGDTVFTSRSGSREGEIVQLSQITLSVGDTKDVEKAADIIRPLLEKFHPNGDFAVVVPKELLRQAEVTRMILNLLLIVIAGISLVVGGIGIMNIMLATVTERTREIGIRRALGARRSNIVQQFLVESVVLTGVGGSLGVAAGFACKPTIDLLRQFALRFFPSHMEALPPALLEMEPRIAPWSIFASLIISILVGMVFGMYPAYRAANMDPIEALRHE